MNDIARYRNIVKKLFEATDDSDIKAMKQRAQQRKNIENMIARIKDREQEQQTKKRYYPGRTYANLEYELERPIRNEEGEEDYVYIMVDIGISGHYSPGYKGSQYEPPEPAGFDDIVIESVDLQTPNPEGGPLTMAEKVKIEQWFESEDGQSDAIEALFDASGMSRYSY